MRAYFDDRGRPKVELEVMGLSNTPHLIDALLDTGHDEKLSLPFVKLVELGAVLKTRGPVGFGNGAVQMCMYFDVKYRMNREGLFENVLASYIGDDEAIAGAELFYPYKVSIDFKNRQIDIEPSEDSEIE